MMIVTALIAIGAMLGAAIAIPIAYSLGCEHTHRDTIDDMRDVRARRQA